VSYKTALLWLHRLGFERQTHKSGQYFDGHESPHSVAERKNYLVKMLQLESRFLRAPPTDEFIRRPREQRPLIEIVQDESICYTYDDQSAAWTQPDQGDVRLKPKNIGRGIMLSAFICEYTGGLLRNGEWQSVEFLEYGQGNYWNSQKMLFQLFEVLDAVEQMFPWAQCLFKFDQSSNHKAVADDALNAKKMNKGKGGAQPIMRPGTWKGKEQPMVDEFGVAKGLEIVLEERGLLAGIQGTGCNKTVLKTDMISVLEQCEDFKSQKNLIEETIAARGHLCVFYPRFHCELSPIELFWRSHKKWIREHCGMTMNSLRWRVQDGLQAVCTEQVILLFLLLLFCCSPSKHFRFDVFLPHVDDGSKFTELQKKGKLS
jgi:hypothetical protein